MTDQPNRAVLLFGAPGVGKGTQGKALGCVPGFVHFSMGDAFRALDADSPLGRKVAEYSSRGELVPDEITVQLFFQRLGELRDADRYNPDRDLLVLDGIPRSVRQVELLSGRIDVRRVLHLDSSDENTRTVLHDRLRTRAIQENRADDAREEVIRRRFEVYRAETAPVLQSFDTSQVVEIDPLGTPAEVLARVLQIVTPIQNQATSNPHDTPSL